MKTHIQRCTKVAYMLAILCCVGLFQLHAGTVALWKLDYSPYTGMNTRCLIDPANDMEVIIQGQQKEPPSSRPLLPSGMSQNWSPLPPNPDLTEGLLDAPDSTNAIFYSHGIQFGSPGVTSAINSLTNSFTVEGWHYQEAYGAPPAIGQYQPFFALGRTYLSGGWSFGYHNEDDTNNLYFALFDYNYANGTGRRSFPTPVAMDTYLQKWCHYALVYDAAGGDGLGTWEIFLDSTSYGVITNESVPTAVATQTTFYLGGDAFNSYYFHRGGYDYWRVSDQPLATNQFLNAGTPTKNVSQKTLAFYRLDVNPDGSFDLSNRVANAWHLTAPPLDNVTSQLTANASQAVPSVPCDPNPNGPFLGNRRANTGSITFNSGSAGSNSYLLNTTGLAARLDTNLAWTVEGWVNFREIVGRQVIFDAKLNKGLGNGWMLLNHDQNGMNKRYCLFMGATPSYFPFPLSVPSETPLNTWVHLALTFDPAAGTGYQGAWELFMEGRTLGRIEYSNTWTRVSTAPADFCLGGRVNTLSDAMRGSMDLVRISQSVLATNQFLNAGGYAATTNAVETLAYWKLDSDGDSINTSSQVDSRYSLDSATNAVAAGSTERCRASILNPDTTPGFIGNPATNLGSVLMTNATALAVGNLGNKLELDTAFTIEGWMKWNNTDARATQVIAGTKFETEAGIFLPPVGTANRILYSTQSGWLLTLEKSGPHVAFHIACSTVTTNPYSASDTIVDVDLATLPLSAVAGGWHHIALTYEPDVNDRGRWTLYVDGQAEGSVENAVAPFVNHESHQFMLGGQGVGTTSFDGRLDCWRASSGVLDVAQMLYVHTYGGTVLLVQ